MASSSSRWSTARACSRSSPSWWSSAGTSSARAPQPVAAVAAQRAAGSPYHLAHGLLDQSDTLVGAESAAAQVAADEAAALNEPLRAVTLTRRLAVPVAGSLS